MSKDPLVRQADVLRWVNVVIDVVNSLEVDVDGANTAAADAATSAGVSAAAALQSEQAAEGFRDEASTSAGTASTDADDAQTARTGAESARDTAQALAAITIVAAGRPDIPATLTGPVATAVAAAGVGADFRSTTGPQGAWVWQKRAAGWTVTDGDTGARVVPVLNGWVATTLAFRRVGRWVTVSSPSSGGLNGNAATSEIFVSIPVGFSSGLPNFTDLGFFGPTTPNAVMTAANTSLSCGVRPSVRGTLQWLTPQAWPTTLP